MIFCAFFMMKAASSADLSWTGRASPLAPLAAAVSPSCPGAQICAVQVCGYIVVGDRYRTS
jgi:hypothetical protein